MTTANDTAGKPELRRWTAPLVRMLRGKRTLAEFGALVGAPKNTVWRWEAARAAPHAVYNARLNRLAEQERFLADWQLVGSIIKTDDLESGSREIAARFTSSLLPASSTPRQKPGSRKRR